MAHSPTTDTGGIRRLQMHYDRHSGQWKGKKALPPDDSRTIKCPICGQIVAWAKRNDHRCLRRALKQERNDHLELEVSMAVAMNGGNRSWLKYGV